MSMVLPVYNETEAITSFIEAICAQKEKLDQLDVELELIFVDDGSEVDPEPVIFSQNLKIFSVTLLSFSRNFGKEAALLAGLERSSGEAVIPFDVDLQDPIEVAVEMIEVWLENKSEIVEGVRIDRTKESRLKVFSASLWRKIYTKLVPYSSGQDVGDFRLLSRPVVNAILQLGEKKRFSKGIFDWVGFNRDFVFYRRQARSAGYSKFGVRNLIGLGALGLLSFTSVPLRIVNLFAGLFLLIASFLLVYLFGRYLLFGVEVAGYLSTFLAITVFFSFNFLAIGILGEYVALIYEEVKNRPNFLIKKDKSD